MNLLRAECLTKMLAIFLVSAIALPVAVGAKTIDPGTQKSKEYAASVVSRTSSIALAGTSSAGKPARSIPEALKALEAAERAKDVAAEKLAREDLSRWNTYMAAARSSLATMNVAADLKEDHKAILDWLAYSQKTVSSALALKSNEPDKLHAVSERYLGTHEKSKAKLLKHFTLKNIVPQQAPRGSSLLSGLWNIIKRKVVEIAYAFFVIPFGGQIASVDDCMNGKMIKVSLPGNPPYAPDQKLLVPLLLVLLDPISGKHLLKDAWILGAATALPAHCIGGGAGFLDLPGMGIVFAYAAAGGSDEDEAPEMPEGLLGSGTASGTWGQSGAPVVIMGTATVGGSGSGGITATIVGQVGPNGYPTTYWTEYGLLVPSEHKIPPRDGGTGNRIFSATMTLSHLDPGQQYYYRIVAKNIRGTTTGETKTFTTGR